MCVRVSACVRMCVRAYVHEHECTVHESVRTVSGKRQKSSLVLVRGYCNSSRWMWSLLLTLRAMSSARCDENLHVSRSLSPPLSPHNVRIDETNYLMHTHSTHIHIEYLLQDILQCACARVRACVRVRTCAYAHAPSTECLSFVVCTHACVHTSHTKHARTCSRVCVNSYGRVLCA